MWKMITEKGEKLPDLLVVLAITVVLAAILLPAVTSSHGNEVNADSGIQSERTVLDGPVWTKPRTQGERHPRMDSETSEGIESDVAGVEDPMPVADASVQPGIASMRTTDISYTIP